MAGRPLNGRSNATRLDEDKDSGIIKDATKIDDRPMDIIPLIERLVYVGVESDRLVDELPDEFEPEDWNQAKTGMEKFL